MIESWMLSLLIALGGIISTFAVMRQKLIDYKVINDLQNEKLSKLEIFMNEKNPFLNHLSKFEDKINDVMSNHNEDIATLKQTMATIPTMEQVRNEFVSKEMFAKLEKHLDDKFKSIETALDRILSKLDK